MYEIDENSVYVSNKLIHKQTVAREFIAEKLCDALGVGK